MKTILILALMTLSFAAQAQPKPPAWWATLTDKEKAACMAEGGCSLVTVARVAEIVVQEAARLLQEHAEKTCRKGSDI